jgi:phasin family protein
MTKPEETSGAGAKPVAAAPMSNLARRSATRSGPAHGNSAGKPTPVVPPAEAGPVAPAVTAAERPEAEPSAPKPAEAPIAAPAPSTLSVSKPAIAAPVSPSPAASVAAAPATSSWMVTLMTTPTFNGYDAFIAFSQSNIDALTRTNQVFIKAIQEIGKEVAALTQAELERAAAATRAALAAKTFREVVEVQTAFATASIERLLNTSTKLGELNVKLATDTAVPITTKVSAALEKAAKRAA